MILLTVGTELPFDRLVRAMDDWAEHHREVEILAQVGNGTYEPRFMRSVPFMSAAEFEHALTASSLVVGHAGVGTVISALRARRPLLVMPRRSALGEHRNDHQVATARAFEGRGFVRVAYDTGGLHRHLDERDTFPSPQQIPEHAEPALLRTVREFIAGG